MDNSQPSPLVDSQAVQVQLESILSSRIFVNSPRLQEFLRYVVDETLAGRAARIKGLTIAHDVFQRDNLEDPQESTIVRVEAGRLRRCLDDYYQTEGQRDPVRIEVPKGTYVPSFAPVSTENKDGEPRSPEELPQSRPFRFKTGLRTAAVLTGLLAVTTLLSWLLVPYEEPTDRSQRLAGASVIDEFTKPAIAVLPFENASGESGEATLAVGLTEDIITEFSKLSGIDVIAMRSIIAIKDTNLTIQQIGAKLRVSHILQGTVRLMQQQLRVTSQLLDAQTGKLIWAVSFDRQLKDQLELQNELAIKVAERLSVSIRDGERERVQIVSLDPVAAEARLIFKQALQMMRSPSNPDRVQIARQSFEKLIKVAPDYAGGYAGAALLDAFYINFGHSQSPEEDTSKAIELAEKAIEIDPSFALAHSAMGFLHLVRRDFDKSLTASKKAISFQPSDSYTNAYHGFLLCVSGQAKRGVEYVERALRLDPFFPRTPYLNMLGVCYFHAGQYQAVLNAVLRNSERGGPYNPAVQAYLVAAYALLGRHDVARKELQNLKMGDIRFPWEDWIRRSLKRERDLELVMRPIRDLGKD